ncbi:hypothetical protein [Blastococcus deserti]|uniref:Uncharacterized protein n=1 Tax=Blastococcus deserti TaxID=2259033 RepID=A0ABW4XFZ8_9ACTN
MLDVLLAAPVLRQVVDAGPVSRLVVLVSGIVVFAFGCATYVGHISGPDHGTG